MSEAPIKLASPALGEEEVAAVARVLASGMLVQGREVEAFERALAERCARAHAIAVSSGTAALELALRAIGVAAGEVIVPDLTWPSPAHAAVLAGANPVLVDVDREEWNATSATISPAIGARTRAVIAIDQFGVPARHPEIAALGPPVIEDAACAIGSSLDHRPCGSFGTIACLSFHPRKVITTGEGGACLTDDPALAAEIRALRNHGQSAPGVFASAGPNLRLTEIQAAIGLAQLVRLPAIIERRRALAERYRSALSAIASEIRVQSLPAGASRNEQSFGIVIPGSKRDRVIDHLRARGIEAGKLSYALHRIGSLSGARALPAPAADAIVEGGLALPLHSGMRETDVDRVLEALRAGI